MALDNQQGALRSSKNGEFLNYALTKKKIQCHSNHSPILLELKKKSNLFFVVFTIVAVTHNTFTQPDIPTQDLPSWLVDNQQRAAISSPPKNEVFQITFGKGFNAIVTVRSNFLGLE